MNKKIISLIFTSTLLVSSLSSTVLAKSFTSKQEVGLSHAWTVKFNKALSSNQDFSGVTIKDSQGNAVPVTVSINSDNESILVTPKDNYNPSTNYTLTVDGLKDSNEDSLSDNATMQFTTAAYQSQNFDINSVFMATNSISGDNGSFIGKKDTVAKYISPNSTIQFGLSKNIDSSTISNVTVTDKDGNKANVLVSSVGAELDIKPNNDFQDDTKTITVPRNTFKCNTTYTINLSGVKSTDGQDIATKSYNFTTRDYKLNPTIRGICDDDYFKFATQYDSDMFHVTDPATGYTSEALWAAHDENGTIVFDKDKKLGVPYQVNDNWNKYANVQTRNQYDLAVQFRKQYDQIKAKDSSYDGKMVVAANLANIINDSSFSLYDDWNKDMSSPIIDADIYYSYSLSSRSLDNVDLYSKNQEDMKNILRSDAHPQIYMDLPQCKDTELSLQKIYLYQDLVAIFGYDYASEISDYMYKESYGLNSERNIMQKVQIGNVAIWAEDGQFLFKY